MSTAIGHWNIVFGWVWINLGFVSGLWMGMNVEQFGMSTSDGTVPWLDGYGSIPRRLLRLGHVAFFMLALLNIVYGQFIDGANLSTLWKEIGSGMLIFGAIGVPVLCLTAAFYRPVKIFLGIPASAVLLANLLLAWGVVTH